MEEQQSNMGFPYDYNPPESPMESESTANQGEVASMKPVQVRLIDYPPGFKSRLYKGRTFGIEGEVFEVYEVKQPKYGKPRFMVRGLGILGIVEQDPQLQETQKGAQHEEESTGEDGEKGQQV